jgi:hypothetical protein
MNSTRSCAEEVKRTGCAPTTEECLWRGAGHICHDLDLFQLSWQSRDSRVGYTMWFITARGLIDFFFRCQRRKHGDEFLDDILAADYLPDGTWQQTAKTLRATRPSEFDAVETAANKLAKHLTYARVDEEGTSIQPSAIVHEFILGVAAVWLQSLAPERRAWFGRGVPCGERAV